MGKLSLKELLKGVINENDQIKSDDLDKLIDRLEILGKKVESEYVPRSTTRRSKVQNYAGGFVFRTNDENIVRRFLIIGSTTGTYYVSGHELTLERAEHLCDLIEQGKGPLILRELVDISLAGSAPKQESTLFALALCARYRVCRIPTHLFTFLNYCKVIAMRTGSKKHSTGFSRAFRAMIAKWYYDYDPERLVMHITKYGSRSGYCHMDLFRLSHIHPKISFPNEHNYLKRAFLDFCIFRISSCWEWKIQRIEQLSGFVHEHVPSHLLNYKEVWTALLKDMPMTAFIRNLGKMTAVGVFDEKDSCALAVSYLTNQEKLRNARIHPLSVLVALSAYAFKSGDCLGKVECIPNEEICSGLSKCFELTFVNVNPTNKRYCVGLDVSGSMYQPASPTSTMNCIEVKTMVFASEFEEIFFNSNWTLQEVLGGKYKNLVSIDFGSTDCALPMIWALEKKEEFDVFIVITDNETWAGSVKPCDALCNYRKEMNIPDAKLIVLAMTATNFTIADPNDSNMLDIVGFDPSIHEMISKFVLGEI
ncbi:unnamed protein product [Dracunculus medinensis]|uniref:TROVE domain-containing protein n=1 Tax=Dracunculus medinensis TaxID=318479 RepID=A0A0N4UQJ8_DRAME|nr:unnamed protein product [Dracunculus medinensis]